MIYDIAQSFFGDESPLKQSKGHGFNYEFRPQQVSMSLAVAEAMDDRRNLCVEAPTGVGKTLAYLVPAVYLAKETNQPVIVSTHTIHLQEQILRHDVPLIESLIGEEINAVVAKGRSNYLCLRRLNALADSEQQFLPGDEHFKEMQNLIRWSEHTSTGDYSEMHNPVSSALWNTVCADRFTCTGSSCQYFKHCYVFLARRLFAKAQLIITNHAFFFAAMALEQEKRQMTQNTQNADKLLPDAACVILDEAHTMEDAAASNISRHADSHLILRLLARLYSDERKTGLLLTLNQPAICDQVALVRKKAVSFFTQIAQWLEPQNKNPLRYTQPGHIPDYLHDPINGLVGTIDVFIHSVTSTVDKELLAELQMLRDTINEQSKALSDFFNMTDQNCVYWMEFTDRNHLELLFNIVPVNIAPLLERLLFQKPPVIITSATLAVNNRMEYFQQRIGATTATSLILDTPFDYKKQVKLYIAKDMPEPKRADEYLEKSIEYLEHFLKMTGGHAFVLFTSYKSLNETASRMKAFCKKNDMTMLVQDGKLPSRKMVELFKKQNNAIIFGTSSFWTGVDVPGDALTNVIITKLPFAVPDNPLVEARTELAEANSRNPFMDYTVPEAVLKFRQGFGRLIRTKQDSGIVVILDSRVITSRYGKAFLNSIPECDTEYV